MSGYIKLHRSIFDSTTFARESMSEREAFVWMISQAAWQNTSHRVGSEVVPVERGSFMVTLREMQSVFMWRSDTKVRNFLKFLEAQGMIERKAWGKSNARKTQITICNYSEYQDSERTENARKTHEKRSKERIEEIKNTSSNEECAQEAFALFSASAQRAGWANPQKLSPQRKRSILARLKDCGGMEGWQVALQKAEASNFIATANWFGLDWLIKPANFTKLMEGNYDNRTRPNPPTRNGGGSTGHDSLMAGFAQSAHPEPSAGGSDLDGSETAFGSHYAAMGGGQDCYPSQPLLRVIRSE